MAFDPVKFLQETKNEDSPSNSKSFDPQSFINEGVQQSMDKGEGNVLAPKVGGLEAFARGALQGGTFGFGEEAQAAIESALHQGTLTPSSKEYEQIRDEIRAKNKTAQAQHPWLYGGGALAGGITTGGLAMAAAPAMGVLGSSTLAGGLGAVAGLGNSEADLVHPTMSSAGQALKDTMVGGAEGLAGGLVAGGIGAGAEAMGLPSALKSLKYGSAGNKPTQQAVSTALDTLGAQKSNLIKQATAEGQQIPVGQLQSRMQQEIASLPKPVGTPAESAQAELQKIGEGSGLLGNAEDSAAAVPENAPEGLLPEPVKDVPTSDSEPTMSPDELDSLNKGLKTLGYKGDLTDTDAAKLAARLLGNTDPNAQTVSGAGLLNGPQGVPGLADVTNQMKPHLAMQDSIKDFGLSDLFKSPLKLANKFKDQGAAWAGYGASKFPGVVPAAGAISDAASTVAEIMPNAQYAGSAAVPSIHVYDAVRSNTAALSRNLYNMPMNDLAPYVEMLQQAGGFENQAQHLQQAIDSGDSMKKNQALFMLLQDPRSRAILRGE